MYCCTFIYSCSVLSDSHIYLWKQTCECVCARLSWVKRRSCLCGADSSLAWRRPEPSPPLVPETGAQCMSAVYHDVSSLHQGKRPERARIVVDEMHCCRWMYCRWKVFKMGPENCETSPVTSWPVILGAGRLRASQASPQSFRVAGGLWNCAVSCLRGVVQATAVFSRSRLQRWRV